MSIFQSGFITRNSQAKSSYQVQPGSGEASRELQKKTWLNRLDFVPSCAMQIYYY